MYNQSSHGNICLYASMISDTEYIDKTKETKQITNVITVLSMCLYCKDVADVGFQLLLITSDNPPVGHPKPYEKPSHMMVVRSSMLTEVGLALR